MMRATFRLSAAVLLLLVPFAAQAQPAANKDEPASAKAAAPAKDYDVSVAVPQKVEVGKPAELTVTVKPKAPWVLKVQSPFSATIKASPGIVVTKNKFGAKDFVDPKSEAKSIRCPITPEQAGEQSVSADLSFFLCTDQVCKRMTDSVTTKVPVK